MRTRTASGAIGLLDDLETALAHGTVARRVETLRKVTDLFLNTEAVEYSDEQLALFDEVFNCLVRHIETSAIALLARRLGPARIAPPQIIRHLACHDAIEVAEPVLSQSSRLDEMTLLLAARTKSQAHLMAISKRSSLSGAVTDVLVERGDDDVVHSTVNNPGAHFTESGYDALLQRAIGDDDLATCIGLRPSIPRHHYLKLIAKASASVRARLETSNPGLAGDVSSAVWEIVRRARGTRAAMGRETVIAHDLVRLLYEDGRLDERQVVAFAEAGKFDETNAAIACLARVPLASAEALMVEAHAEGILILAKVCNLSWTAARGIIAMRDALSGTPTADLETLQATYERLRPSTAQQVLRFHHMQQTSAALPVPAA